MPAAVRSVWPQRGEMGSRQDPSLRRRMPRGRGPQSLGQGIDDSLLGVGTCGDLRIHDGTVRQQLDSLMRDRTAPSQPTIFQPHPLAVDAAPTLPNE